jgi:DNA invertase Pin-like site-specific DNA recombinase
LGGVKVRRRFTRRWSAPLRPDSWGLGNGALAEFERSLIRERTQPGLAAARRIGRTGGRPPKLTDEDIEAAKALLANPDIGVTQIAHRLGVSPATLYRYIPAARTANAPGV